jgi:hypothetical protein
LTLPRHSRWNAKAIERLTTFRGHVRSIPKRIAKLFSLGNPKIVKPYELEKAIRAAHRWMRERDVRLSRFSGMFTHGEYAGSDAEAAHDRGCRHFYRRGGARSSQLV